MRESDGLVQSGDTGGRGHVRNHPGALYLFRNIEKLPAQWQACLLYYYRDKDKKNQLVHPTK